MSQESTFSFTDKHLSLINDKITATVAVVSPKNVPHVTPVGVVENNGKLYFSTEMGRIKTNHLLKNNNIAINIIHPKGFPYITVEGTGSIKTNENFENFHEILLKMAKKNSTNQEEIDKMMEFLLGSEKRILIEITPKRVYPKEDN
ncbi:MAG: hypothetical protein HeimC3_10050 [Candidatus Heimdallarchaeota archaeon LC_3]|nr:MAG: hypothetical protein HeimC3_10050 [Candidatus Heimdallarchaeota archaeon LC_3]